MLASWPATVPGRAARKPAVTASPGAPSARSPRNANYAITARLDPASRTLTGEQLVTFLEDQAQRPKPPALMKPRKAGFWGWLGSRAAE